MEVTSKKLSTKDPEYPQVLEWGLKQYGLGRTEVAEKDIELQTTAGSLSKLYVDGNLVGCFRKEKHKHGFIITSPLGDRLTVLKVLPKLPELYKKELFIREFNDEARATYHELIDVPDYTLIEFCIDVTKRPELSKLKDNEINLKTREIEETDIEELVELCNENFGRADEPYEPFLRACFKTIKKYSTIGETKEGIIGTVFATASDGKSVASLHGLQVKRGFRDRGIGAYLVRDLMQKLYDSGHKKIFAYINESEGIPLHVAKNLGFNERRKIPVYRLKA